MAGAFTVIWQDFGREPTQAPNPAYPKGIDIDASGGAAVTCTAILPYPARRCGLYIATCGICGIKAAATTAGRPDDPRSLKIACATRRA